MRETHGGVSYHLLTSSSSRLWGAPHLGSLGRSRGQDQLRNWKGHCKIQMQSLLFRNYDEFQDSKSAALNRLPGHRFLGTSPPRIFPAPLAAEEPKGGHLTRWSLKPRSQAGTPGAKGPTQPWALQHVEVNGGEEPRRTREGAGSVGTRKSAVGWKVWGECFSRLNCSVALSTAERLNHWARGAGSHLSGSNAHRRTYRSREF